MRAAIYLRCTVTTMPITGRFLNMHSKCRRNQKIEEGELRCHIDDEELLQERTPLLSCCYCFATLPLLLILLSFYRLIKKKKADY